MKRPRIPVRDRILASIEIDTDGCWVWQKSIVKDGYGQITAPGCRIAHRVSYMTFVGPIPDGMQIDHTCHNRAVKAGACSGGECKHRKCVNPKHLKPTTSQANVLGGDTVAAANAAKTHCSNGHEYNDVNTRITAANRRYCRPCNYEIRKRRAKEITAMNRRTAAA